MIWKCSENAVSARYQIFVCSGFIEILKSNIPNLDTDTGGKILELRDKG